MTKKNRLFMGIAVILAVLGIAGITAAAVSNFGTESNPLATKSYIDNVASQNILKELNSVIDSKVSQLEEDFSSQVDSFTAGDFSGVPSSFEVITLNKSQVIRCSVGTEIILRSGSATCYGGSSPRLVNTTTGTPLSDAGSALTINNMYLVTLDNNGLRAQSDGTVILVSGTYTIYNDL